MAPRRKGSNNTPSQEDDMGVDERAIARLEYIALQLSRRRDRSCYKDISVGGNLDEHYEAATAKSILEGSGAHKQETKQSKSLKRNLDARSCVELLSSSQYESKKRKTRTATSHLLETGIGHDYATLVKACRSSYSSSPDLHITTKPSWHKEATTRFTPFVACSPISMLSLSQAVAFYPKPRLVIEACMPLQLVHANSAYFRLSGLSSETAIGSPVSKLIKISSKNSNIIKCIEQTECGKYVAVDVTTQSFDASSGNRVMGKLRCQLYVFPIVADVNSAYVKNPPSNNSSPPSSGLRDVTHFLLELNYHREDLDVIDQFAGNIHGAQDEDAVTLMG